MKKSNHQNRHKKSIAIWLMSFMLAVSFVKPATAVSGSIFFSPSTVTAAKGSQVTLNVQATSSSPFNATQVDIAYDGTVLEYVSYSTTNSVLSTTYDFQQTANSLKITLFTGGGASVSGSNLQLISYTFKVIGSSGSSNLNFMSTSVLVYGNSQLGGGSNQATVTIPSSSSTTATTPTTSSQQTTTPTTTQSSSSSSSTQPSSTSSSSSTNSSSGSTAVVVAPSADTTAPKIISASPFGFSGDEISIKVVTDEPTKAVIKFGPKGSLLYSASTSSEAETYSVPLGDMTKLLDQKTTYVYNIEVTDSAGNKTTSHDYEFTVKPVTLTLKVQDKDGKVLAAQTILVNEKEFTTDSNGTVKVTGVIPGTVSIIYKNGDTKTYIGNLTASKDVANQSFTVTPTKITNTTKSGVTQYILPAVIVVAAFLVGSLLLRKGLTIRRRNREEHRHFTYPTNNAPNQQPSQMSVSQSNASILANARSTYSAGQVIAPSPINTVPVPVPDTTSLSPIPPAAPPEPAVGTTPIVTARPILSIASPQPQQPAETQPQQLTQPAQPSLSSPGNVDEQYGSTTKPQQPTPN